MFLCVIIKTRKLFYLAHTHTLQSEHRTPLPEKGLATFHKDPMGYCEVQKSFHSSLLSNMQLLNYTYHCIALHSWLLDFFVATEQAPH